MPTNTKRTGKPPVKGAVRTTHGWFIHASKGGAVPALHVQSNLLKYRGKSNPNGKKQHFADGNFVASDPNAPDQTEHLEGDDVSTPHEDTPGEVKMGEVYPRSRRAPAGSRPPASPLLGQGRTPRAYAKGGAVRPAERDTGLEQTREHDEEMAYADQTRKYDKSFKHYYGNGEKGFAKGGRVDGSGKVDGTHTSPTECGHLAAGGVCRHLAPSRRRGAGEDYSDGPKIRNFAKGGRAGKSSFGSFLVKRRAARGAMKGGA